MSRRLHPDMLRSLIGGGVAVVTTPITFSMLVASLLNGNTLLGIVALLGFTLQCIGIAAPFITWGNGDVWIVERTARQKARDELAATLQPVVIDPSHYVGP